MPQLKVVEGSYAVAHAVKVCRPNVISAYPITPQTHIVEALSQFAANGEIENCEVLTVESEFSAISALVGASAVGARTYSSTTSQGLALMHEVLFNASGMRLPIVMTVANRALSAPINIWNDQQDSISQRDTGWIQMYAEDTQEAADMTPQLYKICEHRDVLLPGMACFDGFILSHVYEPVALLEQELTDEFLPPFDPEHRLDPVFPETFGAFADPSIYTEFRYMQELGMSAALKKIELVAEEFKEVFGRYYGGLIDEYRLEDAEVAIVAMGSVIGTIKDVIDELRAEGRSVGLLKIRSFRPFPVEAVRKALKNASVIVTLDKNISIGKYEGALCTEIKAALYNTKMNVPILGYMLGHGGRDIPPETIKKIVNEAWKAEREGITVESCYADLREELL
jgi:pyruvate ferredoxin oxidoreductase alpha subunit